MSVCLIIVFCVYFFVVIFLTISLLFSKTQSNSELPKYSIVVAARNEEKGIEKCLNSLLNQSVVPENIFVVDDCSEDATKSIVKNICGKYLNVCLLSTSEKYFGKRAALFVGTYFAETDLILTVDADCVVGKEWAEQMLMSLNNNYRMLSAPVLYERKKNISKQIMYSELQYLMSAGASAAISGFPFQVSGANLCFYRDDFLSFYYDKFCADATFGDDVFFMQYICRKYSKKAINFVSNEKVVVETILPKSMVQFIMQRVRWVAKAGSYKQLFPFLVGSLIVLVNMSFVVSVILFIVSCKLVFLYFALAKIVADILLPIVSSMRWKKRFLLFAQIVVATFYPLYMLIVASVSMLKSKRKWKGRTV